MFTKQSLIDLAIVLVVPILLIGAYLLYGKSGNDVLLSEQPTPTLAESEPGAKTKLALDTLNGITLDGSLFKEDSYVSLVGFYTEIATSTLLYRENPFTMPLVIQDHLQQKNSKYPTPTVVIMSITNTSTEVTTKTIKTKKTPR